MGWNELRILVLSNVPPGAIGGAEVQALHLARNWSASGHEIIIAGHANVQLKEAEVKVLRVPTVRGTRVLRGASYLLSTLWLLQSRRRQFDLIYCRFMKEQALAACIARTILRLRQPIVVCPAAAGSGGDVAALRRSKLFVLWSSLLNRQVACINVMTRRIEGEVLAVGLTRPAISRIPNGIPLTREIRVGDFAHGNRLRLVLVGRLVHQKGIDLLLDALSRTKRTAASFRLDIIGEGPLRASLESLARNSGLDSVASFHGELPPEQIPSWLRKADLFVLPSRFEGMPGSLLEAFAHQLPAVVTRVSGSEDVVDSATGWVVPPDDPEALAAALLSAFEIGRERLQEMGKLARQKIEQNYDMHVVARSYEGLFQELIGKSHGD